MVNNEAILYIIKKISETNDAPCKKTLQKMVYLIKAKGIDLGCNYGIHFYGPYSADLDFAVRELCDEGVLKIEYTTTEHKICLTDKNSVHEYNDVNVEEIINEFAKNTASELELLATALYVYLIDKNSSEIVSRVKKIKGEKYSNQKICDAIQRLKRTEFIVA